MSEPVVSSAGAGLDQQKGSQNTEHAGSSWSGQNTPDGGLERSPGRRTLTDIEVAARLGVSRFTVRSWRLKGVGPRFLKMGRAVRYRPEDVEAYVQQTLIAPRNERATARAQQT
jgi:excisionase family DNA binding protein